MPIAACCSYAAAAALALRHASGPLASPEHSVLESHCVVDTKLQLPLTYQSPGISGLT
jgi:hypothetical protein